MHVGAALLVQGARRRLVLLQVLLREGLMGLLVPWCWAAAIYLCDLGSKDPLRASSSCVQWGSPQILKRTPRHPQSVRGVLGVSLGRARLLWGVL